MANNGTYGINKPANVNENDIDIYYHYRPTRATDSPSFSSGYQKLESNCLIKQESGGIRLNGMYDLKLPLGTVLTKYRKAIKTLKKYYQGGKN